MNGRCCYITVEFATAATQKGVFITQQMCHELILVYDCSMIKMRVASWSGSFKWAGSWLGRDIDVLVIEVKVKRDTVHCHSPPLGIDSADTMDNPHLLPIAQPGSSSVRVTSL
jgi:hypothetical protein